MPTITREDLGDAIPALLDQSLGIITIRTVYVWTATDDRRYDLPWCQRQAEAHWQLFWPEQPGTNTTAALCRNTPYTVDTVRVNTAIGRTYAVWFAHAMAPDGTSGKSTPKSVIKSSQVILEKSTPVNSGVEQVDFDSTWSTQLDCFMAARTQIFQATPRDKTEIWDLPIQLLCKSLGISSYQYNSYNSDAL
ncbi:hypothetical protein C8R45DRAFT_941152 [Mycena sanguinolenta]|nr:hypothetical protein C8R45DRAFT_941152 [Mycena sanguinolenta]